MARCFEVQMHYISSAMNEQMIQHVREPSHGLYSCSAAVVAMLLRSSSTAVTYYVDWLRRRRNSKKDLQLHLMHRCSFCWDHELRFLLRRFKKGAATWHKRTSVKRFAKLNPQGTFVCVLRNEHAIIVHHGIIYDVCRPGVAPEDFTYGNEMVYCAQEYEVPTVKQLKRCKGMLRSIVLVADVYAADNVYLHKIQAADRKQAAS